MRHLPVKDPPAAYIAVPKYKVSFWNASHTKSHSFVSQTFPMLPVTNPAARIFRAIKIGKLPKSFSNYFVVMAQVFTNVWCFILKLYHRILHNLGFGQKIIVITTVYITYNSKSPVSSKMVWFQPACLDSEIRPKSWNEIDSFELTLYIFAGSFFRLSICRLWSILFMDLA